MSQQKQIKIDSPLQTNESSERSISDQQIFDQNKSNNKKLNNFQKILENNKKWAQQCVKAQPNYFSKLVHLQAPHVLWIGCADSRVPANQIIGLKPGQVFVHRNVGGIASPSDINVLAVIQYAVQILQISDIIIAGHYGCGCFKAAFQIDDFGPLQSWLSHARNLRAKYRQTLVGSKKQKLNTLIQLNVRQQVINVSRIPCVQKAWQKGKQLIIHGVVYNLQDGILKDLGLTTYSLEHVPQQYRLAKIPKCNQKCYKDCY